MKATLSAMAAALLSIGAASGQESPDAASAPTDAVVPATPTTLVATPAPAPPPLPLTFKTEGGSTFQVSLYLGLMLAVVGGGFFLLRNGVAIFQPN